MNTSRRRLGQAACRIAGRTESARSDRLGSRLDRRFLRQSAEGGEDTVPNPTDRSKSGSNYHVVTDAQGISLSATVTAANANEVSEALHVLLNMPPTGGKPGPKRQRLDSLLGDRAYDSEPLRQLLRWLGIKPLLAARNTEHGRHRRYPGQRGV